jgi:sulfide:quinone oxidoreductase
MEPRHVVILGAGFGGLELATQLVERLAGRVRVTLVDQADSFVVGFRKFDVLFGRRTAEAVKSYYRDLKRAEVDFRQETVTAIDPVARRVTTGGGALDADVLVVALGADVVPEATPGFAEGGYQFYTVPGAERLRPVLEQLASGTVVLAILGSPYKCPPAPFEAILQLHDILVERGVRDAVTLRVLSPAPSPLPVSRQATEAIGRMLADRGIDFLPSHLVTELDTTARLAKVKDGDAVAYDLFIGVPVHKVPAAVAASGLAPGGWVSVDRETLLTAFPGVYAIGDVTGIPVGQGAVPKAGAFADSAARAVADDIAHRITGEGAPGRFDGVGACFVEVGNGAVAQIQANFLGGPAPDVRFVGPDPSYGADKEAFEATRLARWFR